MRTKRTYPRTQNYLLTLSFLGDAFCCYFGLVLGYLLRVKTPLRRVGVEPSNLSFENYQPLLWLGTLFLVVTYSILKLYDSRLLLRPHRATTIIMRGSFVWFLAFLGFSLVFRFEPAISRIFAACSDCNDDMLALFVLLCAFQQSVARSPNSAGGDHWLE
jgi:hypothetical protein